MIINRLKNDGLPILQLNALQREMKKQIETKIDNRKYNFEEVNCSICRSSKYINLGEKDRYGLYFSTRVCKECGLIYTSPRMTQDSYNEFYNVEYRKLYVGKETASKDFFLRQQYQGARIYDFLDSCSVFKGGHIKTVFEVGCGAGGILEYFREKGYMVQGIDLGAEYVNFGVKEYNLDLDVKFLKDTHLSYKPDLIIYSHVLEHILSPNDEIECIKSNIDERSLVYIEVPGVKAIHMNYQRDILSYLQNAHTYHFTLETLVNLMGLHGFQLVSGNQQVQAIFRLGSRRTEIISDYHDVLKYIDRTEKLRTLKTLAKPLFLLTRRIRKILSNGNKSTCN